MQASGKWELPPFTLCPRLCLELSPFSLTFHCCPGMSAVCITVLFFFISLHDIQRALSPSRHKSWCESCPFTSWLLKWLELSRFPFTAFTVALVCQPHAVRFPWHAEGVIPLYVMPPFTLCTLVGLELSPFPLSFYRCARSYPVPCSRFS